MSFQIVGRERHPPRPQERLLLGIRSFEPQDSYFRVIGLKEESDHKYFTICVEYKPRARIFNSSL